MLIAAIDAGSSANMGWAIHQGAGGCGEPTALLASIAGALARGEKVTLGIEAPLWIPAEREFARMTSSRGGIEQTMRRPWSAGGGTGALAAGLANLAWVLEQLHRRVGTCAITTQPDRLEPDNAILIWEAFVSGATKAMPRGNDHDARVAADAFAAQWPLLRPLVPASRAVNLAAAAIAAAGHRIAPDEFALAVPVIGPSQHQEAPCPSTCS